MTAPKRYRLVIVTPINAEWFDAENKRSSYKFSILFHNHASVGTWTIKRDGKVKRGRGGTWDEYDLSAWRIVHDETITVDN